MKIHAEDEIAKDIMIFNLDNGTFIDTAIWADDNTGEVEFRPTFEGSFIRDFKKDEFVKCKCHCNFVFVYKGE